MKVRRAGLVVEVEYQNACSSAQQLPSEAEVVRWARAAVLVNIAAELVIRVVDEAESAELNGSYRNKPVPTNVLSFPFEAPPGIDSTILGDVAICAAVVEREAREQGKTLSAHWAHMVVHGVLHLQGYDHIETVDADRMESTEVRILQTLGFANPYE
jgi:probable rRNA maturation factor